MQYDYDDERRERGDYTDFFDSPPDEDGADQDAPYTPFKPFGETDWGLREQNDVSDGESHTSAREQWQEPVHEQRRQEPAHEQWQEPTYEQWQEPSYEQWQEPSYSESQDTPQNMYTPGICVSYPNSRKRVVGPEPARAAEGRAARRGGFLRAVCLILACALISGLAAYGVIEYRVERGDFTVVNQVVLGGPGNQPGGSATPIISAGGVMAAEDIYDMARTHVVGIKTEVESMGGLFGTMGATTAVSGTGFIISVDGYILTNFHVIESAHANGLTLNVYLVDGTVYEASIVGFEALNDVAVIKIDAVGLMPASIGNSDYLRVGQTVYAVGNPFGDLVYTMTDGIVSALDRVVTVERKLINTFQFSAAVNTGNSGGPVYDANGDVIGIVTAKLMRGSVEGIGFAIPINDAIEIAAELIEHGYISGRPLMGITGATFSRANAEFYEAAAGAQVRTVSPDSAAERAGILVGDIIIALGDSEIDSMESLRFVMRRYRAGDTEVLTVWRDGVEVELTITFDEDLAAGQPQQPQPQPQPTPEIEIPTPRNMLP